MVPIVWETLNKYWWSCMEPSPGQCVLKRAMAHKYSFVRGSGLGWKDVKSRHLFLWELGLGDQVQGMSVLAHSQLLRHLRWQWWW